MGVGVGTGVAVEEALATGVGVALGAGVALALDGARLCAMEGVGRAAVRVGGGERPRNMVVTNARATRPIRSATATGCPRHVGNRAPSEARKGAMPASLELPPT